MDCTDTALFSPSTTACFTLISHSPIANQIHTNELQDAIYAWEEFVFSVLPKKVGFELPTLELLICTACCLFLILCLHVYYLTK